MCVREIKVVFLFNDAPTHFIYGYLASDILLKTTQKSREKSYCYHFMGNIFLISNKDILISPSHRQNSTYHDLWKRYVIPRREKPN